MPSDVILEGLYKSNSKTLCSFRETVRNNGQTSYLRLKTSVQRPIDQMMRTQNFRVGNEVVERSTDQESKRKESVR